MWDLQNLPVQILRFIRDSPDGTSDWESLCLAMEIDPRSGHERSYHLGLYDALYSLKHAGLIQFDNIGDSTTRIEGKIKISNRWFEIQRALSISLEQLALLGRQSMIVTPFLGVPLGVRINTSDVFVLMPFAADLKAVYDPHIKRVTNRLGLSAARADDIFSAGTVISDVWAYINSARVLIVDCTKRNPNVFYEIGLGHVVGKRIILIAQDKKDVPLPFDTASIRHILYEYTWPGMIRLEHTLAETLKAVLNLPSDLDSFTDDDMEEQNNTANQTAQQNPLIPTVTRRTAISDETTEENRTETSHYRRNLAQRLLGFRRKNDTFIINETKHDIDSISRDNKNEEENETYTSRLTASEQQRLMEAEGFYVPGNIVKLIEPIDIDHSSYRVLKILESIYDDEQEIERVWNKWKGFSYGIIVDKLVGTKQVVLHLYDPNLWYIPIEYRTNIPVYNDISISLVDPHKRVRNKRYKVKYEDFYIPGNIVELREPYKPGNIDRQIRSIAMNINDYDNRNREEWTWNKWRGFSYGIIARREEQRQASLYLYDPTIRCVYNGQGGNGPTVVDLPITRLKPYKRGTIPGYNNIENEGEGVGE